MILDIKPETLIKEIGHDGSEIIWPQLTGHVAQKGFHIQEILDCFWRRGFTLTQIVAYPCSLPYGDTIDLKPHILWNNDFAKERFKRIIHDREGIILGRISIGQMHACAWDGENIYDPRGRIYGIETGDLQIGECWLRMSIT
jgi:hypothetical protein